MIETLTRSSSARLADLLMGVHNVLCPTTGPRQHLPSPLRQYARRPRPHHQRVQLRHDHLLPLLPLRRAPLPDDLQETRSRRLDPDSDGQLVHCRHLPV